MGEKIIWLSHSDVELPEIYIELRPNFSDTKSSYASISRASINPTVTANDGFLVDFAFGVFGKEIAAWHISESYDKESNQSFWNSAARRNPETTLAFRF